MLKLGHLNFTSNIIQGPLAGVSNTVFRKLVWQYSQPAFTCTEMISCKSILSLPLSRLHPLVKIDPEEGPVCFQLSGSDPSELAEAVKRVTDLGASLIDLNCGCPVKKIRQKGAGSRLLTHPSSLYHLIKAMKSNTHVPVSIKIRVEGNSGDSFHADVADAVQDAGADFLIVHGRHWSESYDTPCHYEHIRYFVEQLPIPVIGNGDIQSWESLKRMQATGCAGVMISRASVGQPWLIRSLTQASQGSLFTPPSLSDTGKIYLHHVAQLIALCGNETLAIMKARKLAKYYARELSTKDSFCRLVNECKTFEALQSICSSHFLGVRLF